MSSKIWYHVSCVFHHCSHVPCILRLATSMLRPKTVFFIEVYTKLSLTCLSLRCLYTGWQWRHHCILKSEKTFHSLTCTGSSYVTRYSRTCLKRPPIVYKYMWSLIQLFWNVGPSARNIWSIKRSDLSWKWFFETGFTVVLKLKILNCSEAPLYSSSPLIWSLARYFCHIRQDGLWKRGNSVRIAAIHSKSDQHDSITLVVSNG